MKKSWIIISAYFVALGGISIIVLSNNMMSIDDEYIPEIKVRDSSLLAIWVDPKEWYDTSIKLELYSEIFSDEIIEISIINETKNNDGSKIIFAKIFGNYSKSKLINEGLLIKQTTVPDKLEQTLEIVYDGIFEAKIEQKTIIYEEISSSAQGAVETTIDLSLQNSVDPLKMITEDFAYMHTVNQIKKIGEYMNSHHK